MAGSTPPEPRRFRGPARFHGTDTSRAFPGHSRGGPGISNRSHEQIEAGQRKAHVGKIPGFGVHVGGRQGSLAGAGRLAFAGFALAFGVLAVGALVTPALPGRERDRNHGDEHGWPRYVLEIRVVRHGSPHRDAEPDHAQNGWKNHGYLPSRE